MGCADAMHTSMLPPEAQGICLSRKLQPTVSSYRYDTPGGECEVNGCSPDFDRATWPHIRGCELETEMAGAARFTLLFNLLQ